MLGPLNEFRDILEPRRTELSNFMWVSRQLKTVVPYRHSVKIGPEQLKVEVLRSLRRKLIEETHPSFEAIENKVKEILDEIGYNRRIKVIRWLGLFLAKIFTRVSSGIHVREQSILELKSRIGDAPVIYLPSHRSYADFILMSYICFHYDIEIPAIAAGMDFHGMLGMGTVLRDTGAFFMRRSYNDDSLYWNIFREYVHQLVVKADLGIEFFIEGTRSRTGKSLPPKFGLLTMVLKAFLNGEVPDILFVPINISYDRVMEERLFAFELLGVPKPKESTSAFFKSLKLVNEKYGDIYINFGSVISAHKFFGDRIDRSVRSIGPKHAQVIAELDRQVISALAQEIINCQQKLCVITTFNLVAVSFMNTVMSNQVPVLSFDSLVQEIIWVRSVLEVFGAVTNYVDNVEEIYRALNVHQNLLQVDQRNQILLVQNNIVLDNLDVSKLKGYSLSEKTMSVAVPHVMLQLYVNPTLHYFVNPCLVTVILMTNSAIENDALFQEFCILRSLFNKEFVLFTSREQTDYDQSINQLRYLNVMNTRGTKYVLDKNKKLQGLLCNLMEPFIFTYHVLCQVLQKVSANDCSEKSVVEITQCHIETLLNKSLTFIHPYSLNLDSISNCLLSLVELRAVEKITKNGNVSCRVNVEPVATLGRQLYSYLKAVAPTELCDILDSTVNIPSKI